MFTMTVTFVVAVTPPYVAVTSTVPAMEPAGVKVPEALMNLAPVLRAAGLLP